MDRGKNTAGQKSCHHLSSVQLTQPGKTSGESISDERKETHFLFGHFLSLSLSLCLSLSLSLSRNVTLSLEASKFKTTSEDVFG